MIPRPGRSDVDSDLYLDLDDNDQLRLTYRSKNFRKTPKNTPFLKIRLKKSIHDIVFRLLCLSSILFSCNMVKIKSIFRGEVNFKKLLHFLDL